jgi:hypothetical protein
MERSQRPAPEVCGGGGPAPSQGVPRLIALLERQEQAQREAKAREQAPVRRSVDRR